MKTQSVRVKSADKAWGTNRILSTVFLVIAISSLAGGIYYMVNYIGYLSLIGFLFDYGYDYFSFYFLGYAIACFVSSIVFFILFKKFKSK